MITVHLPLDLAEKFQTDAAIRLPAASLGDVLEGLEADHPGMSHWIAEVDGHFRQHLAVFVSGQRLRGTVDRTVALEDGDEVWVMRAVSGG